MKNVTFTPQCYYDVEKNLRLEIKHLTQNKKTELSSEINSYQVDTIYGVSRGFALCKDSDTDETTRISLKEIGLEDLFGIVFDLRTQIKQTV